MAKESVRFHVPFVMGKLRPRVTSRGTFTPNKTSDAEDAIRAAYVDACPGTYPTFPDGPVFVEITTARHLPESRPKRIVLEPDTFKPDADNVAKLVMDALNGLAWTDDAQVTLLRVHKMHRQRDEEDMTFVCVQKAWEIGGWSEWP